MQNTEVFLNEMFACKNDAKIPGALRFFKTGKGEYGESDEFWGLSVPQQRNISKKFYHLLSLDDLEQLIRHGVHEVRLTTIMMLVYKYQKCRDDVQKEQIVKLYSRNMEYVNNWDLVDSSAHLILGDWYLNRSFDDLFVLAKSGHLWKQRIAVIATFTFIRAGIYEPTLMLAEQLLSHKHDLIHKAVGWMLREIGNRDYQTEYDFLVLHYKNMPRTMLRYAIEKFDENIRQDFLKGRI